MLRREERYAMFFNSLTWVHPLFARSCVPARDRAYYRPIEQAMNVIFAEPQPDGSVDGLKFRVDPEAIGQIGGPQLQLDGTPYFIYPLDTFWPTTQDATMFNINAEVFFGFEFTPCWDDPEHPKSCPQLLMPTKPVLGLGEDGAMYEWYEYPDPWTYNQSQPLPPRGTRITPTGTFTCGEWHHVEFGYRRLGPHTYSGFYVWSAEVRLDGRKIVRQLYHIRSADTQGLTDLQVPRLGIGSWHRFTGIKYRNFHWTTTGWLGPTTIRRRRITGQIPEYGNVWPKLVLSGSECRLTGREQDYQDWQLVDDPCADGSSTYLVAARCGEHTPCTCCIRDDTELELQFMLEEQPDLEREFYTGLRVVAIGWTDDPRPVGRRLLVVRATPYIPQQMGAAAELRTHPTMVMATYPFNPETGQRWTRDELNQIRAVVELTEVQA